VKRRVKRRTTTCHPLNLYAVEVLDALSSCCSDIDPVGVGEHDEYLGQSTKIIPFAMSLILDPPFWRSRYAVGTAGTRCFI
jgi:hypothetical protein